MLIANPFNIMPRGNDFLASAVRKITTTNFDINAKVQVFESGGGLPRESIFIFDYIKNEFFPLTIGVNWGTTDRIKIIIEIKYNIKIPYHVKNFGDLGGEASGTILGLQEWVIQYPEQGLLISKTNNNGSGVKKSDGDIGVQIACDASESPQGIKGPFIAINTNISISKSSSSLTVGVGINNAKRSGSISTEITSASSSSRSTNYEFKVNLSVLGRPKVVTSPKPLEVPEYLLSHNVYFEKEDQKDMGTEELRRLEDWVKQIQSQSPKLYNAIKSGRCQIQLSGYTSTTGKEAHNEKLSINRLKSVNETLKTDIFKSKNLDIDMSPLGEKRATQKGAVTRERRVEIVIPQSEAIAAMQ